MRPITKGFAIAAATAAAVATATVVTAPSSSAADCSGFVALTFDDGPNPDNTRTLLDALEAAGVRATMFNVGQSAEANPDLVLEQVEAGHWIGNHSFTHTDLTTLGEAEITDEIVRTQEVLTEITGDAPVLFRPPFLATNATVQAIEAGLGVVEINADIVTFDFDNVSAEQIIASTEQSQDGDVILLHDFPPNTITAIPQMVTGLADRGLCAGMIDPDTGRAVAPN